MSEKRMFSKSVICSDEFLEMPDSTQCLYFHLSMNADDDGFVDKPKGIMRMIGAKEDDLKVLITKSFVLPFETGVIVIKHWRLNNYIQKDRKKDTIYQEELSRLRIDSTGAYTFGDGELPGVEVRQPIPLTPAQQKRADAKKESELPYSFEYKVKAKFIGKQCPICGKTMSTFSKKTQPTIQHNLPISKGGKHELGNISIVCGECSYSIQDNETEKLNSDEVIQVWNEIKGENVSGMDTQYRLDKNSIEEINNNMSNENQATSQAETVNVVSQFEILYKLYPCSINKQKKTSLNLYYNWLVGKQISIMGSRKTTRYNHFQMLFALKQFIENNKNTEENYIPRLPTFLGEKTLCDYVESSKPAYTEFMQSHYGDGWEKVKFQYVKGGDEDGMVGNS